MAFIKSDYSVAVIFAVWVLILASWAIFVVHINENHEESVRNTSEARNRLVMSNSETKRVLDDVTNVKVEEREDLKKCIAFIMNGDTNRLHLVRSFDCYIVDDADCVKSNGMRAVWMPCIEK